MTNIIVNIIRIEMNSQTITADDLVSLTINHQSCGKGETVPFIISLVSYEL